MIIEQIFMVYRMSGMNLGLILNLREINERSFDEKFEVRYENL